MSTLVPLSSLSRAQEIRTAVRWDTSCASQSIASKSFSIFSVSTPAQPKKAGAKSPPKAKSKNASCWKGRSTMHILSNAVRLHPMVATCIPMWSHHCQLRMSQIQRPMPRLSRGNRHPRLQPQSQSWLLVGGWCLKSFQKLMSWKSILAPLCILALLWRDRFNKRVCEKHPNDRKIKAGVVFRGDAVKDQDGIAPTFQELQASAPSSSAGLNIVMAYSMIGDNTCIDFRLHSSVYPVFIEIKASDLCFIATGTCSCEQKTHCSTMCTTAQGTLWTSRVQCSLDCILLTFQRTRWTARIWENAFSLVLWIRSHYWCQCM